MSVDGNKTAARLSHNILDYRDVPPGVTELSCQERMTPTQVVTSLFLATLNSSVGLV